MKAGDAARRLGAQRQKVPKVCPVCGRAFKGLKTATYCGPTCRHTAAMRRYRAR